MLICSGDLQAQAAALEALVHAVEDGRLPLTQIGGRAEAAAPREGALSRRAGRFAAGRAARRCAGRSDATSIARSPTRWRGFLMLKPRALGPGDPLAIVAPASPFTREEFDRALPKSPPRLHAGVRRLGVRAAAVRGRLARVCARGDHLGLARSGPSPASSPCAAATAARSCCRCSTRRTRARVGKPFIGYSDLTSLLTFLTSTAGSWRFTDRCSPDASAAAPDALRRASLLGAICRREALGELAPAGRRHVRAAARPSARCSAARSRSCSRRSARRSRSIPRTATSCFSTRWASGRIASTAW